MLTLYHGSTEIVKFPKCIYGRDNLDFGKGFYLTDIRGQAVNWSKQVALKRNTSPLLNIYSFDKEKCFAEFNVKVFPAYNEEWLNFIVSNRKGSDIEKIDYIEGGVADDRVINTVNLFIQGFVSMEDALYRLSFHKPNNQICLTNQLLVDSCLSYIDCFDADE